jgi:hypothetical protein
MIDNTTVRLEATLDITKSQTFTVSASIASASDSLVVKLIPPEIQSIELSFANERDSLSKAKDVITIIAQLRGGLNPTNIT